MNPKSEMNLANVERLLLDMAANKSLDVEVTDSEIDLALLSTPSANLAEQFTEHALLKMQDAQNKREQRLPSFNLGKHLADVRLSHELSLSQVAAQSGLTIDELESLERGIWSFDQIIRKFPAKLMARILNSITFSIRDFSDDLLEVANNMSSKSNGTGAYARIKSTVNTTDMRRVETLAEYISELQQYTD